MIALVLVGCAPKVAITEATTPAGHPELVCPAGTSAAGFGPPLGTAVWCQRLLPGGSYVREGPSLSWHVDAEGNATRRSEGSYVDDEPNGPWLYLYPHGSPERRGNYLVGVKDGRWTNYHPNGAKAAEGVYVDGFEHGPWEFWGADLTWRSQGTYVMGDKDGLWLEFGPAEQPMAERVYRDGRMISVREL